MENIDVYKIARDLIRERYGNDNLPPEPRQYSKKVKNAQEAHEAIRPAGDRVRTVQEVAQKLGPDEARAKIGLA